MTLVKAGLLFGVIAFVSAIIAGVIGEKLGDLFEINFRKF